MVVIPDEKALKELPSASASVDAGSHEEVPSRRCTVPRASNPDFRGGARAFGLCFFQLFGLEFIQPLHIGVEKL
jgi:hypothetical protein